MFSSRLKELRAKKGLSQAELAKRLGVTQQAVGRWERDKNLPDNDILKKISVMFGVSLDYLLDNNTHQNDALPTLTPKESSHLQKYRALDDDGRELVDGLLDTLHEQRSSKFNTSSDKTTAS